MFNRPRMILVVEENDVAYSLLSRKLSAQGYFVRHVGQWTTAMKFAEEIPPRIMVIDYDMMDLEHDMFINHAKALKSKPEIIFFGSGVNLRQTIAHNGLNYFLPKPLNGGLILSIIHSFSVWIPHYARYASPTYIKKRDSAPVSFAAGE